MSGSAGAPESHPATVLREQQALGEAPHKAFATRLAGGSPPGETAARRRTPRDPQQAMTDRLPVGPPVLDPSPCELPGGQPMAGRTVRLDRLDAARDVGPLFGATHGGDADPGQWTYMAYGPFESADAMRAVMARLVDGSQDPQWWLVREVASDAPVGMAAFMNMVPAHRRLELGHIWYVPAAQRTAVNTETIYLMLGESFDRRGYRRVEWKCDALNARSRKAAVRVGLPFRRYLQAALHREGTQPRHRVVRHARYRLAEDQGELRGRSVRPGLPRITDCPQPAVRGGAAGRMTSEAGCRPVPAGCGLA